MLPSFAIVKDKGKNRRVKDYLAHYSLDLHQLIDGTEHKLELSLEPEGSHRFPISPPARHHRCRLAGTLYMTAVFQDASNLFGLPLADVCRREQRPIPYIITKCVEEIRARGLEVTGG